MSFKDTGIADLEDMYMGNSIKDQAAADAANFDGSIYSDGMMVVPQGWERLGTAGTEGSTMTMSRPVTSLNDGNMHVFVDGEQAVLLQGTTTTLVGQGEDIDKVQRSSKAGLV